MSKVPDKSRENLLIGLWRWGLLVGRILLWEAGSRLGLIDAFFFSCPTEIAATLQTAQSLKPDRLIVLFQPSSIALRAILNLCKPVLKI
jgi:ABC-type nitrate/sulfonate/bicarbonate transport system permease component